MVAASATASTAATAAAPRAAGSTGPAESASAEAFASDIFGRVRKRNRLRDWREPLRDYETWLGEDCRRRVGSLQPFFTAAEFAALYKDAWRPSPQEPSPDRSEPHPYLKKLKVMGPLRRTRTLPAFNTALLQDLMPATGCKPPGTRTGVGAVLTYRPDGRLAHIKLASERLSPACTKAVTVATLLTVRTSTRRR